MREWWYTRKRERNGGNRTQISVLRRDFVRLFGQHLIRSSSSSSSSSYVNTYTHTTPFFRLSVARSIVSGGGKRKDINPRTDIHDFFNNLIPLIVLSIDKIQLILQLVNYLSRNLFMKCHYLTGREFSPLSEKVPRNFTLFFIPIYSHFYVE